MRKIDPAFQARLDGGATKMCRCWRVIRKDGRILGFTDHDLDLVFEGVTHRASTGLDASVVQSMNGLSVDNGQVVGALSDRAISEVDIAAGKYDAAEVYQWLVDWEEPSLRVLMFRGTFGEIHRADGKFEVELRGLAEALNVPVGRFVTRTCDCLLGDKRCGFDTDQPRFTVLSKVSYANDSGRVGFEALSEFPADWFSNGRIDWLSEKNLGVTSLVRAETLVEGKRVLSLWQAPPGSVSVGDHFRIIAGCDKQFGTCRTKFRNILNFRGFPHIPGEDWVTAYPKGGTVHDGRSQQQ